MRVIEILPEVDMQCLFSNRNVLAKINAKEPPQTNNMKVDW